MPAIIPTQKELYTALEERHGKALQATFSNAAVAVCGLGGLGSNIAVSLARAGIGRLLLFDFDTVDISNLNRQQYAVTQIGLPKPEAMAQNLQYIAPYCDVESHIVRLTEENIPYFLHDADIICEAFDDPHAKAILVDTVLERLPAAYMVAASGMSGLHTANTIRTRRLTDRLYLCGDGESDIAVDKTLFAPRVMLCAAHQAQAVLRILAGEFEV